MRFYHRRNTFASLLVLVVVAVLALGLNSCSDDPVAAPTGNSNITVLHTNPAYTSNLVVKQGSNTIVAALSYGIAATASIPNGSNSIKFLATDATELAQTSVQVDSTKSGIVIFTGKASQNEGFSVVTSKITPPSGNASIRVVNASITANGPLKVTINDSTGLNLATGIAYKTGGPFVSVPVASITTLVVLDNSSKVLLSLPVTLVAGKQYTFVVYGSTGVTGTYGLTAMLNADIQ